MCPTPSNVNFNHYLEFICNFNDYISLGEVCAVVVAILKITLGCFYPIAVSERPTPLNREANKSVPAASVF